MNKYNVKVSKLEDGSYKLKINNADYYGLDEFEALAIKYLQNELQQKDHIIEELEKWLKDKQDLTCGCGITVDYLYAYENCLDKLKELKENNNE